MSEIKKSDWENYRQLEKGETIQVDDEVLCDSELGWLKTNCVGGEVPDPQYSAHRIYRRLKIEQPKLDKNGKN